jgi:PAS domain S-box-containing protein
MSENADISRSVETELSSLKLGDHVGWFYESDSDRDKVLQTFIKQGLERHERVCCLLGNDLRHELRKSLRCDVPTLDEHEHTGALTFIGIDRFDRMSSASDVERMLHVISALASSSVEAGFRGFRASGDMRWILQSRTPTEILLMYETQLNRIIARNNILALCQYDMRSFDPAAMMEILSTHPITIIETEVQRNFYYVPPRDPGAPERPDRVFRTWLGNLRARNRTEAELRAARDDLEQRVHQRTAELAQANRELSSEVALRKKSQAEAEERDKLHRLIIETAKDVIWTVDLDLRFTYVSPSVLDVLGYTVDELMAMSPLDALTDDSRQHVFDLFVHELTMEQDGYRDRFVSRTEEIDLYHKEGHLVSLEISTTFLRDPDDKPIGILGISRDLTERKRAEEALRESEQRYRVLFENSPISLWEEDWSKVVLYIQRLKAQGIRDLRTYLNRHPEVTDECAASVRIVDVNQATLDLFSVEDKQKAPQSLNGIITQEGRQALIDQIVAISEGRPEFETETTNLTLNGDLIEVFLKWAVAPGFSNDYGKVLVSIMDITERKRAEERLKDSLAEKEVLLREIHHRVKNNLQLTSSLLRLQARHVTDEVYRRMFTESEGRLRSMASVHEKLYQSKDLARIDMRDYLHGLASTLFRSGGELSRRIDLHMSVQPVAIGADTAIPCGLIANELISNCIKHAFPEERSGSVTVIVRSPATGEYEMVVRDDGVGIPEDLDYEVSDTLGLRLVRRLVQQLRGTMEVVRSDGTEFRMRFFDVGSGR